MPDPVLPEVWVAYVKRGDMLGAYPTQDDALKAIYNSGRQSGRTVRYLVDKEMLFDFEGGTLKPQGGLWWDVRAKAGL